MNSWKSSLLWALYPFLLLFLVFGFIAALNWGYESKLIFLNDNATDWAAVHIGPILLAGAMVLASIASFCLFLVRIFWPKAQTIWFMVPLTIITIFLIFPGLFIIILGPAIITTLEQTRSVSK